MRGSSFEAPLTICALTYIVFPDGKMLLSSGPPIHDSWVLLPVSLISIDGLLPENVPLHSRHTALFLPAIIALFSITPRQSSQYSWPHSSIQGSTNDFVQYVQRSFTGSLPVPRCSPISFTYRE